MATTDFANLPGRGIKPLVSFRAHGKAALIAFFLTLIAGIPAAFIKGEVFYSTVAVVQVAPRYMKTLRDDGELDFPSNTQYREFLEQQTKSVTRYDIVRDALMSLGDKAQAWRLSGDSERKSVELLREALVVRSIPDTYMIEIRLQSKSKDGLSEVVNAVVGTYLERMRTERVFGADVRVRMLEAREAEIVSVIEEKTAKRTGLALQLGIGAFSGKEENPYDRVLADLRSAHADARNKRFEAESQLKAFENNGETDIKTRSVQEAVLIDPGLSNLKANLFKRRADLLTQLSGLQPAHPVYAEVTEELRRIDSELNSQTSKLKDQVQKSVLARYRTSVEQSGRMEGDVNGELQALVKKGANFSGLYNQAMTLTYDIDQQRKELEAVRERLNHFAAEQNSFGFVRLVTPALPPEMPYGLGKKKILLAALGAAFLMMLVLPILIDLMDRRIHTVNDAEKLMGIPALGWMVERSNEASKLFGDDLLRRLAGSLISEHQRQGTRVFAFSSVKPAGGTSELVLSLAKTLDALGYPTLAVEGNAFRRDPRYAGAQSGFAECLRGEIEPSSCIAPADAWLPARVHAGDTGRRGHLDRLDQIKALTGVWSQQFNFVLIDLPPLLLSADTEIVARDVAHLIVVIEAKGISSGELRRAARQLEKLDPAALGMVINRVQPFDGGGYLEGNILEYLSGRNLRDYFTKSRWSLSVSTRWIEFQMRYPSFGALTYRIASFLGGGAAQKLRNRFRRCAGGGSAAVVKTQSPASLTRAVVRSKKLVVSGLLIALAASALFLVRNPGSWVDLAFEETQDEQPVESDNSRFPNAAGSATHSHDGRATTLKLGKSYELKLDEELPPVKGGRHR